VHHGRARREDAAPLTVAPAAVSPRMTSSLAQRRTWERRYRTQLHVTDMAAMVIAGAGTVAVQVTLGSADPRHAVQLALLLLAIWTVMLACLHTRDSSLLGSGNAEYRMVAQAAGGSGGILAIIGVLFEWDGLRPLLFLAVPAGTALMLLGRWNRRRWLQARRAEGEYASRVLVVGNKLDVEYVISTLQENRYFGYQVLGATLIGPGERDVVVDGVRYPVLGHAGSVAQVAGELGADTIVVASKPESAPDFIKHLSWQLEGTAAELVLSSRLTDVAGPRISLRQVEGLPLIRVRIPDYEGSAHLAKRALDIAVSGLAVVAIALITPVIALAIKLDDGGPVFFRQTRIGKDGTEFGMLKFRTMCTDAEAKLAALKTQDEGNGVMFKMKHDPRVTRVGAFLRKTSLDGLPQFWNVLRGDMSVVGPRPPLPVEVATYDGTVARRLYIKPGITGLWQISGRSDLSWDDSIRLDLRYVENWSLISDLQIMFRTGRAMIQPKGAY
jgi:exopolysaccharide biosynthesis polyprenyl glycosylphosphotransferase